MPLPEKADLHLTLSGSVEIGDNGEGAKTVPIKIVANSGNPVDYPKVGRIVFDMSSMTHKPKVQLDWEHDRNLGFLNKFDAGNGLALSGAIVPGHGDDADFAQSLIAKMKDGVPYEASIESHGGRIETLSAGKSAVVNGSKVDGPIKIIRDWTLAAVALCKFGKDSQTTAELVLAASRKESGDNDMNDELLGKIRLSLGTGTKAEDVTADNAVDLLLARIDTLKSAVVVSDDDFNQVKLAFSTSVPTDLTKANCVVKLATHKRPTQPKQIDAATMHLAGKAWSNLRSKLMEDGDQTKAMLDALEAPFIGATDVATLTLARTPSDTDEQTFGGLMKLVDLGEKLKGCGAGLRMSRVRVAEDEANPQPLKPEEKSRLMALAGY